MKREREKRENNECKAIGRFDECKKHQISRIWEMSKECKFRKWLKFELWINHSNQFEWPPKYFNLND
jgi:hypothetical protein